MATCPSGHESADDDFCDVCGFAIGPIDARGTAPATVSRPVIRAPQAPRPSRPSAAAWTVVVSADRAYYDLSLIHI